MSRPGRSYGPARAGGAQERGISIQRRQELGQQARRGGARAADAFRARRERRAGAQGFASLDALLHQRYVIDRALVEDICAELGCSYAALRKDFAAAGIALRRGRPSHRAPMPGGRAAAAASDDG
jgi:hypothetical protein